mmetsp:Transcript_78548/g.156136  ORF Transcript_78548/g.156136 Transcript_78548/m.156136 type:complete len:233 (-) Transcript_78548:135-833(-)
MGVESLLESGRAAGLPRLKKARRRNRSSQPNPAVKKATARPSDKGSPPSFSPASTHSLFSPLSRHSGYHRRAQSGGDWMDERTQVRFLVRQMSLAGGRERNAHRPWSAGARVELQLRASVKSSMRVERWERSYARSRCRADLVQRGRDRSDARAQLFPPVLSMRQLAAWSPAASLSVIHEGTATHLAPTCSPSSPLLMPRAQQQQVTGWCHSAAASTPNLRRPSSVPHIIEG